MQRAKLLANIKEIYPIEDIYGTEIQKGDIYYRFGECYEVVVSESNLDTYILENLKGALCRAW